MSEKTYTAKDHGPNGWGVSTYIDGRFSQTLFALTEAEAIGMAVRWCGRLGFFGIYLVYALRIHHHRV